MRARTATVFVAGALAVAALAGCSAAGPATTPVPTSTPTPTLDAGTEVLPTTAPTLRADGTADQNRRYWDAAIEDYWHRFGLGSSQTMVDQLASWGFDLSAVEVTYDSTAIGIGVDSIETSVRFGDECLLATVRAERFTTAIAPLLGTGTCLVGETRPVG